MVARMVGEPDSEDGGRSLVARMAGEPDSEDGGRAW